jgi:hypothetical protein
MYETIVFSVTYRTLTSVTYFKKSFGLFYYDFSKHAPLLLTLSYSINCWLSWVKFSGLNFCIFKTLPALYYQLQWGVEPYLETIVKTLWFPSIVWRDGPFVQHILFPIHSVLPKFRRRIFLKLSPFQGLLLSPHFQSPLSPTFTPACVYACGGEGEVLKPVFNICTAIHKKFITSTISG